MAGIKVVTTKQVPWRDRQEVFSNVYFFGSGPFGEGATRENAQAIVDALLAAERAIMGPEIGYISAKGYNMQDTAGDTAPLYNRVLTPTVDKGLKAVTGRQSIYVECAVDIKWHIGGRRYLRSMLHCHDNHGLDPEGKVKRAPSAEITAFADKMMPGNLLAGWDRISPGGDRPVSFQVNPYLEHRQFHRMSKNAFDSGIFG